MADYIDREAALDIFGDVPMWNGYFAPYPWEVHCTIVGITKLMKEEIRKISAADVVPVVHCKDCANRGTGDCPMERDFPWISSDSDGFCHRGERKEDA